MAVDQRRGAITDAGSEIRSTVLRLTSAPQFMPDTQKGEPDSWGATDAGGACFPAGFRTATGPPWQMTTESDNGKKNQSRMRSRACSRGMSLVTCFV